MATQKTAIVEAGQQQASLVVNNAFIDGLSAQLKKKEEYGLTFPKDYNPTNELMGAYLILKDTVDNNKRPVLETCSRASIANALMEMVTSGVSMQKKQAYAVAYGGKLQMQMSVYGNTCIARRYGMKNISAMIIYDGDTFEYHIEDGEIVIDKHTQDFMSIDTDKIKGAYAIAKMNDGTKHVELMNMMMIKKAWSQGYGYKEDNNGNPSGGTHKKFTDQMCLKTVKNRCLKYIIRTYGEPTVADFAEKEEPSNIEMVQADVKNDIATNANTVEFPETIDEADAEIIEPNASTDEEPGF